MFSSRLVISNCIEMSSTIGPNVPVHCHVDPAIDRHREPHVVRVGVVSILIQSQHVEVLFETLITPVLSKYFEMEGGATVSMSTRHYSIDEHILCS